ncbi:MAG: PAC2 family protein [Nitrososphaeraceae archaeon]
MIVRLYMRSDHPEINIVYSSKTIPTLRYPVLICGFPGSGYVGKLAVDHLIHELNATHLADIYSTSFPAQLLIRADGTADLLKNYIFYSNVPTSYGTGLLLLSGDSQPSNPNSEYFLAEEILDIASRFSTGQVLTLAAYITGTFVTDPRIFGTAGDLDTIKTFNELNVHTMEGGSITGMNGIVVGIAKRRGMKGTCLLGETSGYVIDAKASKAILETVVRILNLKIDMTNIERRAKDTEMLIKTIEQQMTGTLKQQEEQQSIIPNRPSDMGYIS